MGSCGAPQLPIPLLWATCLEQDGKCNLPLGPPGEARAGQGAASPGGQRLCLRLCSCHHNIAPKLLHAGLTFGASGYTTYPV